MDPEDGARSEYQAYAQYFGHVPDFWVYAQNIGHHTQNIGHMPNIGTLPKLPGRMLCH